MLGCLASPLFAAVVPIRDGASVESDSIPALDEATWIALDATPDGRDLRDEAWHRLVAEAARWPRDPQAFARATLVRPAWSEVVANPDRFRGMLFEVQGRLEQSSPVRTPGIGDGEVFEWFVRTGVERGSNAGEPVVQVFVPADAASSGRVGRPILVVGRLLRGTDLAGRDGTTRRFATIVGVPVVGASASSWSPAWAVALATLLLLPIALIARRLAKQARSRRPPPDPAGDAPETEFRRDDLPSDPAEALGVLAAERSGGDR